MRELYAHDAANVFLSTENWAEEVIRNPLGDTENPETITVVFNETRDQGMFQFVAGGEETKRTAHMSFAHAQEMHERDTIIRLGETWSVNSDPTTDGVLKTVSLELKSIKTIRQASKRGA